MCKRAKKKKQKYFDFFFQIKIFLIWIKILIWINFFFFGLKTREPHIYPATKKKKIK
jgi:hypothetical protein